VARRLLAGAVVAAVLAVAVPASAGELSILRSASVVARHLVLQLSVRDLRPTQMIVAKRGTVGADGALLPKNTRLREPIQLPGTDTGLVLWKSSHALLPGVYFAQVKAIETGGVTDCPRFQRNCLDRWSNVRRVVVRASG
jgi:hypothetical protein